jgi:hypothetical protein
MAAISNQEQAEATRLLERRGDRVSPKQRLPTGSMLFPDLVWAHWAWQQAVRPHRFVRRSRFWRIRADNRQTRQVIPTGSFSENGGPTNGRMARTLEQEYLDAADLFQRSEGEILKAYWCATEASAVVLTEKTQADSGPRSLRRSSVRIHRATDWVTSDAPDIANLLALADTLAIKVTNVLSRGSRSIAMEWIFNEQSFLLGFVERMGGHPSPKASSAVVAQHGAQLKLIEQFYDRAGKKVARMRYLLGMVIGLVVLAGVGAGIAGLVALFGTLDLASDSTRTFFACFGAGAVGAIVSVMTRMRQADGFSLDYEVGRLQCIVLGGFRPLVGAVFGTVAYFGLQSGLIPVKPSKGDQLFYFALLAFLAGFSERFTQVVLGGAELSVAKALPGAEPIEQNEVQAPAPTAGTSTPADANRAPPDDREQRRVR